MARVRIISSSIVITATLVLLLMPGATVKCGEAPESEIPTIGFPAGDATLEAMAAREIERYFYLRTGWLPRTKTFGHAPANVPNLIFVASKDNRVMREWIQGQPSLKAMADLGKQDYWIKTIRSSRSRCVLVVGGSPVSTLYAAYRFAEHLGVRFYLHGDVIPDKPIEPLLPIIDDRDEPLFNLRGIQPFHDFPEGPDWWNRDDYLAILGQLPKLGMNFFALHTYPEDHPYAEPTTWIGLPQDVEENGRVKYSYPSSYQNTARNWGRNWGYEPKETEDFVLGAAQLFDRNKYGPDVMGRWIPAPTNPRAYNEVFNRTGELFNESFEFARMLGIKTCIGTETPLTVPAKVKERLESLGKSPDDPAVIQELYEGMFTRIQRTHPLDYYWFWTPESWTWRENTEEELDKTRHDLLAAIVAAKKMQAPFTLATCGWVLGPYGNRSMFDEILPKEMPMSCINRQVGFTPVEPGFANVTGRPKWAIPWLEDDPALTSPQLWVGRMRADAADALQYGCTGLMGIHWRTRALGPNVSALAKAAWSQEGWGDADGKPRALREKLKEGQEPPLDKPSYDFYLDWAGSQFGEKAAEPIAKILSGQDGRLHRPSDWVNGPGGLKPDAKPWSEVEKEYDFVRDLAKLRSKVDGAGSRDRFDYWMHTFRYMKAMAELCCVWSEYNQTMESIGQEPELTAVTKRAKREALPLRMRMLDLVREVYAHMLPTVSNPGELGTVANWEQHILPGLLNRPAKQLEAALGEPLPDSAHLPRRYDGPTQLIVPTVRTSVCESEPLALPVLILSEDPPRTAALFWRPLGEGEFRRVPLQHQTRGVYAVQVPARAARGSGFEYYIEIRSGWGKRVVFPATAPKINQTVVVMPGLQLTP